MYIRAVMLVIGIGSVMVWADELPVPAQGARDGNEARQKSLPLTFVIPEETRAKMLNFSELSEIFRDLPQIKPGHWLKSNVTNSMKNSEDIVQQNTHNDSVQPIGQQAADQHERFDDAVGAQRPADQDVDADGDERD
ncbi:uncharacterized protein LOC100375721 [Saccoglossus kowalevskii]|uniref:Uncharacterized protein LOC100375721 n=1 Tax=Saccoglossus kowalevskii TaxID=10224 RepID=A0ABM0GRP7_SACKO|nr:PREDICTED: uncharacterized protein LOC100375721 [Saccoglossus kowalevskii]